MSTRECYISDVMALENVEPEKRKVLCVNLAVGGVGLENHLKWEIVIPSKIF